MRSLALFLTVGFFSSAVFLAVPEDVATPPGSDAGADAFQDRTAGAVLLAGAEAIEFDGARRAPALAGTIRPRRYDEVVKDELVLEVVREDGRPIVGATVVGSHEDAQFSAMTDAAGRVVLRAFADAEADLTVARGDFVAHKRLVRLDPGTEKLVVPTRSSLKGRVRVRGSGPRGPMGIGLVCGDGAHLLAISDAQGDVEFFNLPADWTGALCAPQGHRRDEPPYFFSSSVSTPLYYSRPRHDDGRRFPSGILTPFPATNRIASTAVLGVAGDIDVGTFLNPASLNPGVNPGSIIGAYEDPPLDKPGITIVDTSPARTPEAGELMHDAGIIDLIPMREVRLRIVDSSDAAVPEAQAYVSDGSAGFWVARSLSGSTFWIDADRTIDQIREAFLISAPSMTGESWTRVDGQRIVLTESGDGEITVTVRGTFSVPPPDTSPAGLFLPFDTSSDR